MNALKYQISSPFHELLASYMVTKMGGGYRYLESRIETTFFFRRHKKWQLLPWLYICGPIMTYVTLPVTDEWSHIGRFSAESDIITSAIKISINKTRTNQITCTAALYKNSQDISSHLLLVLYTSRNYLYLLDCGRWGGPSVRPICEYPQYILDRF